MQALKECVRQLHLHLLLQPHQVLQQQSEKISRSRLGDGKPSYRESQSSELIRLSGIRNGKKFYEEDIIYDRESEERPGRELDMQITRRRSASAKSRRTEVGRESNRRLNKDMWTEVTKDLVIREAIEEMGYEFEEAENFFYVIEYLRYVSRPTGNRTTSLLLTLESGGCCPTGGADGRYSS